MRIKSFKNFFLFLIVLGLAACNPTRYVKPLKKDEQAVNVSLGGPMINFAGAPIPIPYTTISYGYGVTQNTTMFAGIHTTSALFGNFQTDLGAVRNLYYNENIRFGVSALGAVNVAVHKFKTGFRVWPQVDVNAYWNYKKEKESMLYGGLTNWFERQKTRAHGEPQNNFMLLNPHIGHVFNNGKWSFTAEAKYLLPSVSNQNLVVDYVKFFGKKGALGIYFGVQRNF